MMTGLLSTMESFQHHTYQDLFDISDQQAAATLNALTGIDLAVAQRVVVLLNSPELSWHNNLWKTGSYRVFR